MSDNANAGRERFHLCLSCGRLKHEDLFGPGDCTCQDCYDEVDRGYRSSGIRYKETPDGEGFVLAGQNNSETNLEGSK